LKLIGAELAAVARLYEWGGYDKNGKYLFDLKRPGWGKPIQQIMKVSNDYLRNFELVISYWLPR